MKHDIVCMKERLGSGPSFGQVVAAPASNNGHVCVTLRAWESVSSQDNIACLTLKPCEGPSITRRVLGTEGVACIVCHMARDVTPADTFDIPARMSRRAVMLAQGARCIGNLFDDDLFTVAEEIGEQGAVLVPGVTNAGIDFAESASTTASVSVKVCAEKLQTFISRRVHGAITRLTGEGPHSFFRAFKASLCIIARSDDSCEDLLCDCVSGHDVAWDTRTRVCAHVSAELSTGLQDGTLDVTKELEEHVCYACIMAYGVPVYIVSEVETRHGEYMCEQPLSHPEEVMHVYLVREDTRYHVLAHTAVPATWTMPKGTTRHARMSACLHASNKSLAKHISGMQDLASSLAARSAVEHGRMINDGYARQESTLRPIADKAWATLAEHHIANHGAQKVPEIAHVGDDCTASAVMGGPAITQCACGSTDIERLAGILACRVCKTVLQPKMSPQLQGARAGAQLPHIVAPGSVGIACSKLTGALPASSIIELLTGRVVTIHDAVSHVHNHGQATSALRMMATRRGQRILLSVPRKGTVSSESRVSHEARVQQKKNWRQAHEVAQLPIPNTSSTRACARCALPSCAYVCVLCAPRRGEEGAWRVYMYQEHTCVHPAAGACITVEELCSVLVLATHETELRAICDMMVAG